MVAWRREMDALRNRGLEPIPDEKFVGQLIQMISYLCGLITNEKDALNDCKSGFPSGDLQPVAAVWIKPLNGKRASFLARFWPKKPVLDRRRIASQRRKLSAATSGQGAAWPQPRPYSAMAVR